jgi:predicted HD superfamily hydrolase involved in NAD metabolism
MKLEEIVDKLAGNLSPKRLQHSQGVSETAALLARRYGADENKARLAGMLHDCAREMPSNILLQTAEAFGIVVNDVERRETMLLHAPVGAFVARRDYGLADDEIFRAITWHTTGGPTMTLLDEIIFLADYIEPGRTFPGVNQLRALAQKDLNKALLAAYDNTLGHLIQRGGLIHPATIEGRNAILTKLK